MTKTKSKAKRPNTKGAKHAKDGGWRFVAAIVVTIVLIVLMWRKLIY